MIESKMIGNQEDGGSNERKFSCTRVLILGCPPLLAQGMRLTLEKSGEFEVVSEANSCRNILEMLELIKPNILLFYADISQRCTSEITCLSKQFQVKIIVLSSHQQDEQLIEAIKLGAVAYLTLTLSPENLLEAVRRVARGYNLLTEAVLNKPNLVGQMVEQFRDFAIHSEADSNSNLSEREMEVLQRLAHGDSNKEIARDLNISGQTVKNHVSNIFRKLNVDRRTRAVLIAIERGWIKDGLSTT